MLEQLEKYLENIGAAGVDGQPAFSKEVVAESIVLMLKQMMFADGTVKKSELDSAVSFLKSNYLDEIQQDTQAEAKLLDAEAQSIFPLATILRKSLSTVQLQALRDELKRVAMSDGVFHPYEKDFLELFDELIGTREL